MFQHLSILQCIFFLEKDIMLPFAVCGWRAGIGNSSNSKKFRSVRMSGKLAKMSEKSDFEIFVPTPLFSFFMAVWQCSTELTLKKIMPLNLLSGKNTKKVHPFY